MNHISKFMEVAMDKEMQNVEWKETFRRYSK